MRLVFLLSIFLQSYDDGTFYCISLLTFGLVPPYRLYVLFNFRNMVFSIKTCIDFNRSKQNLEKNYYGWWTLLETRMKIHNRVKPSFNLSLCSRSEFWLMAGPRLLICFIYHINRFRHKIAFMCWRAVKHHSIPFQSTDGRIDKETHIHASIHLRKTNLI